MVLVEQQPPGDVGPTHGCQGGIQVTDAGETCAQVPAQVLDVLDQVLRRKRPCFRGQQVERQRQHVSCLRLDGQSAVGQKEFLLKRLANAPEHGVKAVGVVLASDLAGHAGELGGVVGPVGRGQQGLHRRLRAEGRVGRNAQPVAVVVAQLVSAHAVRVGPLDAVQPGNHRAEVPLDNPPVVVHAPDRPGDDHAGVGPACRPAQAVQADEVLAFAQARGCVREDALGCLGVLHVDHPLGEEGGHVHVICGRAREDLGVAHPAQPLVALRAIRGHTEEVALLTPQAVAPQPVDPRVRALEFAGGGCVRVNDTARDIATQST
jgi:hypothetical protein